ncbi:rhomboid domain-containing protein [Pycnococcus provasolii]
MSAAALYVRTHHCGATSAFPLPHGRACHGALFYRRIHLNVHKKRSTWLHKAYSTLGSNFVKGGCRAWLCRRGGGGGGHCNRRLKERERHQYGHAMPSKYLRRRRISSSYSPSPLGHDSFLRTRHKSASHALGPSASASPALASTSLGLIAMGGGLPLTAVVAVAVMTIIALSDVRAGTLGRAMHDDADDEASAAEAEQIVQNVERVVPLIQQYGSVKSAVTGGLTRLSEMRADARRDNKRRKPLPFVGATVAVAFVVHALQWHGSWQGSWKWRTINWNATPLPRRARVWTRNKQVSPLIRALAPASRVPSTSPTRLVTPALLHWTPAHLLVASTAVLYLRGETRRTLGDVRTAHMILMATIYSTAASSTNAALGLLPAACALLGSRLAVCAVAYTLARAPNANGTRASHPEEVQREASKAAVTPAILLTGAFVASTSSVSKLWWSDVTANTAGAVAGASCTFSYAIFSYLAASFVYRQARSQRRRRGK